MALIVVEGGDRVGKSTFCRNLAETVYKGMRLRTVVQLHYPGPTIEAVYGEPLGEHVPEPLTKHGKDALKLLKTAPQDEDNEKQRACAIHEACRLDRKHSRKWLLDRMEEGVWIICDRYAMSGAVYSAARGVISYAENELLDEEENGFAIRPDFTFYLALLKGTTEMLRKEGGVDNELDLQRYIREVYVGAFSDRLHFILPSKSSTDKVCDAYSVIAADYR